MATILAFFLSLPMVLFAKIAQESVDFPLDKYEEFPDRACPTCGSENLIKNGSVHNSKSKHQRKSCGRQVVDNPSRITISNETKQLINRLLLERISLRGIARVTQISWYWLQDCVNQKLAHTPRRSRFQKNH